MSRKKANSGQKSADKSRIGLRKRAEDLLDKGLYGPVTENTEDIQKLVQELQIHQVELEMQNQELLQAHAEAEEARRRYFDLYDLAPVCYLTLDEHAKILEINLTGANLLGEARSRLVGRRLQLFVSHADIPLFNGFLGRIFTSAAKQTCELTLANPEKVLAQVRIEGALVEQNHDAVPQCRIIIVDITERVLTEQALRISQKFADLGTLSAGIAHEINTPLQVITGSADSLLRTLEQKGEIETGHLKHYLQNISRDSWQIAHIVRSLNTYAHPDDSERASYSINALVRETLLLIEHQLNTWSNIRIELKLGENLPGLLCNRNDISQVLINLIKNGRDAMPNGGLISLSTYHDSAHGELVLEVADRGVGIPVEIRERIFDPFFTTKPVGKGSGLGLSIVLGIMENYSGRVDLESSPGNGSTFRLIFPASVLRPDSINPNHQRGGRYEI